jgi:hypothetical protein
MLNGPCHIHYAFINGKKSVLTRNEGLQDVLKTTGSSRK